MLGGSPKLSTREASHWKTRVRAAAASSCSELLSGSVQAEAGWQRGGHELEHGLDEFKASPLVLRAHDAMTLPHKLPHTHSNSRSLSLLCGNSSLLRTVRSKVWG